MKKIKLTPEQLKDKSELDRLYKELDRQRLVSRLGYALWACLVLFLLLSLINQ